MLFCAVSPGVSASGPIMASLSSSSSFGVVTELPAEGGSGGSRVW